MQMMLIMMMMIVIWMDMENVLSPHFMAILFLVQKAFDPIHIRIFKHTDWGTTDLDFQLTVISI